MAIYRCNADQAHNVSIIPRTLAWNVTKLATFRISITAYTGYHFEKETINGTDYIKDASFTWNWLGKDQIEHFPYDETHSNIEFSTTQYQTDTTKDAVLIVNPVPDVKPVNPSYSEQLTNCTSNFTGKTEIPTGKQTWTVTANTGFELTTGTLSLTDSNNKVTNVPLNFTDKNQISFYYEIPTDTTNVVLTYDAKEKIVNPTYSENLTNCTTNFTGQTEIPTGTQTWTLTANTGYELATGELAVTDSTHDTKRTLLKADNKDKETFDYDIPTNATKVLLTFTANAPKQPQPVPYNEQIENCTTNFSNLTELPVGNNEITITANDGYEFSSDGLIVETINGTDTTYNIPANNKSKITFTFNVKENATQVTLKIVANEIKSYADYKETLTNCTSNFTGQTQIEITKQKFTFIANTGYMFKNNGRITIYTFVGDLETIDIIANNQSTLSIDVDLDNYSLISEVDVKLDAVKATQNTSNFSNVYLTNQTEINQLSSERIAKISGSGALPYDYGTYISELYKIPFNLPDEYIGDRTQIILGDLKANTTSTQVINSLLNLDLGKIVVPNTYNSSLDYLNTKCTLYAPLINSIDLNPKDVIGKTLSLKFNINLYNGNATITVYNNDDVNRPLNSYNQNIGEKIPFIQDNLDSVIGTNNRPLLNDIRQAFIVISRPKPVISTNGYDTREQGKLINYKGITAIDKIDLDNSTMTDTEYNMIINLLKKGVKIK